MFYKGANGRMQHLYWQGTQWRHEVTGNYAENSKHHVDGDMAINSDNQIFYRGADGLAQHFYWNNPCYTTNEGIDVVQDPKKLKNPRLGENELKVSPNPSDGRNLNIKVNIDNASLINLSIRELISGNKIVEIANENISGEKVYLINLPENLPNGLYLSTLIINNQEIITKKFLLKK